VIDFNKARTLLTEFKGDSYLNGNGVLSKIGEFCLDMGKRVALVYDHFPGSESYLNTLKSTLKDVGIEIINEIQGAAPNAPLEDLARVSEKLKKLQPDFTISFGGGSTIDTVKAAGVLNILGADIESYFGVGKVTEKIIETGESLSPHLAIQTAASSGAHLTKYSNITDLKTGQKKLIVDKAIVPPKCVFDYEVTFTAPLTLTIDGALDGFSHSLEVLYGAVSQPEYQKIEQIALEAIRLVVKYLPQVLENPKNADAREGLGLATDLGGYAIMLGGTNGAHLTSFSLVDILSHGRACGMLNPYYTVFFAPAIRDPLQSLANIFTEAGYGPIASNELIDRDLGLAVAKAMIDFQRQIGFPTSLQEVEGFLDAHIEKALTAAKNPQLKMKLENMPIAMTAEDVDTYMAPILEAAKTGELSLVKNM
jgi:alcohol dehydrogenase